MKAHTKWPLERWPFAALVLGGICVAFGQGRWPIPLAAWLAPILLIAWFRATPLWLAFVGLTLVHGAAWEIAYMGMVKMPLFARLPMFAGLSFGIALFYFADRVVAARRSEFLTTLVLPCGLVLFDWLNGHFSPSGSWGSIAYTFTNENGLAQVASLVGWTGITFLVGWVATVTHWVSRRGLQDRRALRAAALCAGALLAALAYGGLRVWQEPAQATVRVATIVGPSTFFDGDGFCDEVWAYTRGVDLPAPKVALAQQVMRRALARHLELAERELAAGARVVLFPEANPSITKQEEPEFVERAGALAAKYDAYVGLGPFVFRPRERLPAENKFVLLGPDGEIVWDYLKAKLVPGSSHVVGDGVLPDVETEVGRLSCAICFDMDFPALLAQAGGADIVLAPSNDWTEVRTLHARMARMRAIEQGFNLVRPTKDGFTLVTDARGRTIVQQDTDRPGEHVVIAEVPRVGTTTVYSLIGDTFAWLCIAGLAALLLWSWRRHPATT